MRQLFVTLVLTLVWALPQLAVAAEKVDKVEKVVFTAITDSDGVQRAEITGGGYFFRPNYLIIRVNVPVELKVKKESGFVPHNIVMKEPAAGMVFDQSLSSDPVVIKFTPTKVGKYQFSCSKRLLFFESHREKGMEGTIEVVE